MRKVLEILVVTIVIMIFVPCVAVAQSSAERFCKEVETALVKVLAPTGFNRRLFYDDGCDFEFRIRHRQQTIRNIPNNSSLEIEKYSSAEECRKDIQSYLSMVAFDEGVEVVKSLRFSEIENKGNWDEIYFWKAEGWNHGFIILRKDKYEISIFSRTNRVLRRIEKFMRGINIEKL